MVSLCMSSNKDKLHISLASKNLSSTARQSTTAENARDWWGTAGYLSRKILQGLDELTHTWASSLAGLTTTRWRYDEC
eukprot:1150930-Pelagomonas_calceolata.AAC.2